MNYYQKQLLHGGLALLAAVLFLMYLTPATHHGKQQANTPLSPNQTNSSDHNLSSLVTLVRHKPKRVQRGYIVVPVHETEKVLLMDRRGKVLHHWPVDAARFRLLRNCRGLVVHGTRWGMKQARWKKLLNEIREYKWNGDIAWKYRTDTPIHHDVRRLPSGNTIFLQEEIQDRPANNGTTRRKIKGDLIKIISRNGRTAWRWNSFHHLPLTSCGWKGCDPILEGTQVKEKIRDWTHGNTVQVLPENKWYDEGDERFRPGNILYMPRNFWTALVIDRDTKKVVWRYEGRRDAKDTASLTRGHEAHMIPPGRPGAGNILIFDNGHQLKRPYSRALEIHPQTKEIVWSYKDEDEFFSRAAGALQRLENGNTLVSEDIKGRIFELTPDNEIVWEVDLPYRTARAKYYPKNWCERFSELS